MAQDYRTAAPRIADIEPLPIGPSAKCPACKTKRLTYSDGDHNPQSKLPAPRACTAQNRVRISWFRSCQESGAHLHESCDNCGHSWLSLFAEVRS